MKKTKAIVAVLMLFLLLTSCNAEENTGIIEQIESEQEVNGIESILPTGEEVILPPVRLTTDLFFDIQVQYIEDTSLKDAINTVDAIAHIRIGNWIEENRNENITRYEAETITVYEGELPQEFVFTQAGTSYATLRDQPLSTYGNEYFVFLYYKQKLNTYNAYRIFYFYDVIEDDIGGEQYIVETPVNTLLKLEAGEDTFTDYSGDRELAERIMKIRAAKDNLYSANATLSGLYKVDEVVAYINRVKE